MSTQFSASLFVWIVAISITTATAQTERFTPAGEGDCEVWRAAQDPESLLDGLEGYAATPLRRAFANSRISRTVVNKTSDNAGDEAVQGTIRHAVESARNAGKDAMTWIVFDPRAFPPDTGGAVELRRELVLGSNTIVDGRGAKVTLWSRRDVHLLKIDNAKNVILKNLILHKTAPFARSKAEKNIVFPVGPHPGIEPDRPPKGADRDGISIRGASDGVWIDHCTLYLCGDESIGVMSDPGVRHTSLTVSWCKFYDQYYVALIGHTTEEKKADERIRLTFHHNRIIGGARRNPRVNRCAADIYNNHLEGWKDWGMAANAASRVLVEANVFEAKTSTQAVYIGVGTHEKGFVRLKNNLSLNGAELKEHRPSMVPDPPYPRTVHKADRRLVKLLESNTGWSR